MDQAGIIQDLLSWLENNMDTPLSIDNVAARAGYSKWHLQRMFKDVTGEAIGAYIRGRRLSKAAIALRLTARPILDIALQYRFDSQQTFTRAFKRQFSMTPALYRRSSDWNAVGMCPPLRLDSFSLPKSTLIALPETHLLGLTSSYNCTLEQLSDFLNEMRSKFWRSFFSNSSKIPEMLYGLNEPRPSTEKDDEQEVFYTTALLPKDFSRELPDLHPIVIEAGDYAQFDYEGSPSGLQDFILSVYDTCMPSLQLTRRKGQDIERFFISEPVLDATTPAHIRCEYLIPIRR